MTNIILRNDYEYTPSVAVSGTIVVRPFAVYSPTVQGSINFDGRLTGSTPRQRPLFAVPGLFRVQGSATAGVKAPAAAFKDFAHYPYAGVDPAMAWVGITSGSLKSAVAGSYSRPYAAFTGPVDYPVSGGGLAWRRAAYASVGFKFAGMTANKHQILDAVQIEPLPLASTGPSAYQNAREIQVVINPTRLNFATNPNMEAGTTGYLARYGATLATDAFCWQGTQSMKVTVPADSTLNSGAAFQVSGLIPGRYYTFSAKVAVAASCGDVSPWSGASGYAQASRTTWRQAADTADPTDQRWRTVSVTFKASDPGAFLGLNVDNVTTTPGVPSIFWVDGVMVEEGASARPYFDGSMGADYLWETGGSANLARSYYYENRVERGYLVKTLLAENVPLGTTAAIPQFAVLPNYQGGNVLLVTDVLTNPNRIVIADGQGTLATLTVGAKTVTVRGPQRTFTEQKRPFTDNFTRTFSSGWGTAPAGGTWQLVGAASAFSVDGSVGRMVLDTANVSRHATLNDADIADVSVSTVMTVDKVPTGAACSVALQLGWQDSNNQYRARVLFNTTGTVQHVLEVAIGGTVTTLGTATTVGTGFTANQKWRVRAERVGNVIRSRAWLDGSAEPSTWTFSVTDTNFMTGKIGIRGLASTGNTNLPVTVIVDDFAVASATWAHPPVVTHTAWVRTLDAPFDGNWTPEISAKIANWAVDTSNDALAYAMKFITGAPAGTGPDGKAVGQAAYGPMNTDGTRIESSDWNDYLGIGWTYPDGEVRTFPHGSITTSGGMDCSGFIRTVYGRFMHLPMSYSTNFDGLNIPRASKDMAPYGPGIVVQSAEGTSPSLTGLLVGDVVFFDADDSDPVDGQIDHVGIYLGVDTQGNQRFISSRKTVNGPTFSDLGGNSTLNGAGTYATRLRSFRRF